MKILEGLKLNTNFLQDIQYGTLDPVAYGGFNTSDAYYFLHGAEDYVSAASRAMNLHNDECSVELKKGLQSDDFSVYKAVLCSLTQLFQNSGNINIHWLSTR